MQKRKLLHERTAGNLLVGIFVAAAAFSFAWLLIFREEEIERYELIAEFNVISSVSKATKIKLRGFTIGQVQSVEFRPQPEPGEAYFLVTMAIESIYPVPEGVVAEMKRSGLVGDTFINLNVNEAGTEPLSPGSRIRGREKGDTAELMARLTEMAQKLAGAGEAIRRADLGYRLGRVGDGIHIAAKGIQRVSNSADSLLTASRHLVNKASPELEQMLVELRYSAENARKLLGHADTLVVDSGQDVRKAVSNLNSALERLSSLMGRVESFVVRKESQIDSTLNNVHSTSQSARELAARPWKFFSGTSDKKALPTDREDNNVYRSPRR